MEPCPGIVELEQLTLGGTPTGAAERSRLAAVEHHVEHCSSCRARLDEMREASDFITSFQPAGDQDDLCGVDGPGSPLPQGRVSTEPAPPDALSDPPLRSTAPAGLRDDLVGYAVESILDVGGQGVVYRATQRTTGRVVAIKLPHGDAAQHPARRYRLRREIELLARLDHPGIIRVYGDCRTHDGEIGCVMELVCGVRFDVWAAARRAEDASGKSTGRRRIVEAVARIADAVGYAHRNGVLHRDLTPRNVIVTDDGTPRVLDFGLAKAIDRGVESFETLTGAFIGTLTHAAPEQLESSDRPAGERGDVRSDVHGLGLLLYVLRKTLWRNRLPAAVVAVCLGAATVLGALAFQSARSSHRASLDRERAEEESLRVRAIAELLQAVTPPSEAGREDAFVRRMLDGFEVVGTRLEFGAYSDDPAFEAMLRMTLASLVAGDPAISGEGERYARDGLRSRHDRFGAEHPETAAGHHDLARVLLIRRRHSEALDQAHRALEIRLRHLGPSDQRTLESIELLARAQLQCGRFDDADATIALARGADDRVRHDVELRVALDLAESEVAEGLGDTTRSWTACDSALESALAGLHDEHPALSRAISRSGALARSRGEPAPEIVAALDTTSPARIAATMTALAQSLDRSASLPLGQRPERLTALNALLALRRAHLGERHVAVGRSLASLGVELTRHFRFEEAEAVLGEGHAILVECLGPDDLAARSCRSRWEATLVFLGRFAEAAETMRTHIAHLEAAPSASPDPFVVALSYGYLLRHELFAGEFERAERTSREALDRIEQVFGGDHHALGLILVCRAVALGQLGRHDEVEGLARHGLAIMEQSVATPPDQMLFGHCFAGTALCLAGHDREGADLIEPAIVALLRAGYRSTLDLFLATLSDALRRLDGEAAATRAAALPETVERRPHGVRIGPEDVPRRPVGGR